MRSSLTQLFGSLVREFWNSRENNEMQHPFGDVPATYAWPPVENPDPAPSDTKPVPLGADAMPSTALFSATPAPEAANM